MVDSGCVGRCVGGRKRERASEIVEEAAGSEGGRGSEGERSGRKEAERTDRGRCAIRLCDLGILIK